MTFPGEPGSRYDIGEIIAELLADWPGPEPSELAPGLWQGGTNTDEAHGYALAANGRSPYRVVITLFDGAPLAPNDVEEHRLPFEDAELKPEEVSQLLALAEVAHARWKAGEVVLVRCEAGVNRSGLVSSMVLLISGLTPAEAIGAVRAARGPMALSNESFERWVLSSQVT